jgi:hypothetical protein
VAGPHSLNAITPPAAVLTSAASHPGEGEGLTAAVLVPALLGLIALLLAGTALLRKRRPPARREG